MAGARKHPRVVIVGAGIGGASCAYFLSKELPAATITVLEAQDRIGGRVHDVTFWGHTVNVGAAVFNEEQRNIAALVKELKLKTHCFKGSGDHYPNIYVWDGQETVQLGAFMANQPTAHAQLQQCLKDFLSTLERTYQNYDQGTFSSVGEFLTVGGLECYTRASVKEFFQSTPVTETVQHYAIETIMREFFGQGLESSAVLAMVCVAGLYQNAYKTEGGMQTLVKALIASSSCNIYLNSRVASVKKTGSGTFEVWYSQSGDEAKMKLTADVVIVAAPFEWAGVEFEGFNPSIVQPEREWERLFFYVTHVAAKSICQSYFKTTTSWSTSDSLLLTATANTSLPWICIRMKGFSNGCHIFSVYSQGDIAKDDLLGDMFDGVQDYTVNRLKYLHPLSTPSCADNEFQDIRLADGVYYLNGLESVASQMEIAVISGRNVARLISRESS